MNIVAEVCGRRPFVWLFGYFFVTLRPKNN